MGSLGRLWIDAVGQLQSISSFSLSQAIAFCRAFGWRKLHALTWGLDMLAEIDSSARRVRRRALYRLLLGTGVDVSSPAFRLRPWVEEGRCEGEEEGEGGRSADE